MLLQIEGLLNPIYEKLRTEGVEKMDNVFFMKQKIGNACGTFALFHSLANNRKNIDLGLSKEIYPLPLLFSLIPH